MISQHFLHQSSLDCFQQRFFHQIQRSRKLDFQRGFSIHQFHGAVQQVADIVNAAPYFRHAAVYAEESVNSFHCGTNGILCREDGISWCLSELSEECEVDAAIRDDIRAVALSSWHKECGDVRHHGRYADSAVLCQLRNLVNRHAEVVQPLFGDLFTSALFHRFLHIVARYIGELSAQLSGSYNSAVLGANLAQEEDEDLKIHVFNSRSASIGETLIVKKIVECEEAGMSFERVVETVELYISTQHTYFVLENLETLRKNGRLSKTKALVASALKIKPVMGATSEGDIVQLDQARGINKALMKMVDAIVNDAQHVENKTLAISHCNCPERAEMVKEALLERLAVQDVFVLDTQGVSSMYANDGGIIIAL